MHRIFAIGDIHGCLEKLQNLLSGIDMDPRNDTLLFIGDYVDRGKFSREVVDHIIRIQSGYKNVFCLLGNHEQMFMRYLNGEKEDLYLGNGGAATLESYQICFSDDVQTRKDKIPPAHRKFFESLLPYYETEHYIFVHAGIRPGIPLKEQDLDDLLWIRYDFIYSERDFSKTVVFGHTPSARPLIEKNKIGIDTGAVYGGKLTCVELPALKIYQV